MNPNLAILSLRGLDTHVSRCTGYELEDLLCSALPGTSLYAPQLNRPTQVGLKIQTRLAPPGSFGGVFNDVLAVEEMDDHEVFLAVVGGVHDLHVLGSLKGWRRKSRYAICRLDEFWVDTMPGLRRFFRVLEEFDLIFCSEYYTAEKLREELSGPEVLYSPPGVDALTFAPVIEPAQRPIDVTNLGSLAGATHQGLLEYAERTGGFYFFETLGGRLEADAPAEHRRRYAEILKRSKYFLCFFALMRPEGPPDQLEFGPRYIEGVAAGCVLLGSWASTPAFDTYLGWEDAVLEMPFECEDPSKILCALDRQPERLREISLRNVRHSLEHLDHAHRWKTIVDRLRLPRDYYMSHREEQLASKLKELGYPPRLATPGAAAG